MIKTKIVSAQHCIYSSKGQSLVEFALAATMMIFLLLATIDFGLAFFSWITLRDAAQEGATYGSIYPPSISSTNSSNTGNAEINSVKSRVRGAATTPVNMSSLPLEKINILLLNPDGTTTGAIACPGYGIQVTVIYDYHVITPMISTFINSPTIPVTATVTNTILRKGNGVTCP